MKKTIIILVTIISLASCKKNNEKQVSSKSNLIHKKEESTKSLSKTTTKNNNVLCQINGKDWAYTKASGIVSTHPRTKKRTALITFKKKLERGSENIQLHYDADSFELEFISLQLKFKKKSGKLSTCYYNLKSGTKNQNLQSKMSGNIDLSNATKTSGEAEILNINIKYEKELLQNPDNAIITITDLKFTDIGYSDIDKISKSYQK